MHPYFLLVHIRTIDEFCRENQVESIDFLKIDVEGYEYYVLKGGQSIVTKSNPLIYLELYDYGLKKHGFSATALIQLLFEMGYTHITNAYNLSTIDKTTDLTSCDIDIIAEKRT